MYKKSNVTAAEMLTLREQGYNNAEIAEQLDVSTKTVYRYIGGCRNVKKPTVVKKAANRDDCVKVIWQVVEVHGYRFDIDLEGGRVCLEESEKPISMELAVDEMDKLIDALALVKAAAVKCR